MEFSLVARFDTAAARNPGRSGPALVVFDWKNVWSLTILPCLRVLTVFPTVGAGGWGIAAAGSALIQPSRVQPERCPGSAPLIGNLGGRSGCSTQVVEAATTPASLSGR
jgi:hypothetical protein